MLKVVKAVEAQIRLDCKSLLQNKFISRSTAEFERNKLRLCIKVMGVSQEAIKKCL